MKVFVTGGSGFIGGHVIEALARHHDVSAMARSDRSVELVTTFGATPVRCSLGSLGEVGIEVLQGVDAVVHCAAFVEEWGTRQQFWSVNVDGTTQLLEAARAAGVTRFVHIGTEAALFDGHDLIEVDETCAYPSRHKFLYSETKAEAEKRVLAANDTGFHTVSVRPRLVWGPRDASVLPAIVRMVDSGKWRWLDGGAQQTSSTHVANLVHGVSLALEKGEGGNAYFVADAERSTMRDFLTQLLATQGRDMPEKSVGGGLARSMAWITEGAWRLFRKKSTPPMTRFSVSMMSSSVTIRWDKAAEHLGYKPVVSVADGMAELASAHVAATTDMTG